MPPQLGKQARQLHRWVGRSAAGAHHHSRSRGSARLTCERKAACQQMHIKCWPGCSGNVIGAMAGPAWHGIDGMSSLAPLCGSGSGSGFFCSRAHHKRSCQAEGALLPSSHMCMLVQPSWPMTPSCTLHPEHLSSVLRFLGCAKLQLGGSDTLTRFALRAFQRSRMARNGIVP